MRVLKSPMILATLVAVFAFGCGDPSTAPTEEPYQFDAYRLAADSTDAIADFLARNPELDIEVEQVGDVRMWYRGDGRFYLAMAQAHRGILVLHASMSANIDSASGRVLLLHSNRFRHVDPTLSTTPDISADSAVLVAVAAYPGRSYHTGALGYPPADHSDLHVVFPSLEPDARAYLAWMVQVQGDAGIFRYTVDAHTGDILIVYEEPGTHRPR